jgi:hypothetical protein
MSSNSKKQAKKTSNDVVDYLFDYFADKSKIQPNMMSDFEKKIEGKIASKEGGFVKPVAYVPPVSDDDDLPSSDHYVEMEGGSVGGEDDEREDGDEQDEQDNEMEEQEQVLTEKSNASVSSSRRQIYGKKLVSEKKQAPNSVYQPLPSRVIDKNQLLGDTLIGDMGKYQETPEEKRCRARENYNKLRELVESYDVVLTREYTVDDDPDEMEAEYDMHANRRNKKNQTNFYKQILTAMVTGIDFVNTKYDPFKFKLKGWGRQFQNEVDDYDEVLGELYEKYKGKTASMMGPEARLMGMVLWSGVTFHITQYLGPNMSDVMGQNTGALSGLLGGLSKQQAPSNNDDILQRIKQSQNRTHAPAPAPAPTPTSKPQPDPEVNRKLREMEEKLNQATAQKQFAEEQARRELELRRQADINAETMRRNNVELKHEIEKSEIQKRHGIPINLSEHASNLLPVKKPTYLSAVSDRPKNVLLPQSNITPMAMDLDEEDDVDVDIGLGQEILHSEENIDDDFDLPEPPQVAKKTFDDFDDLDESLNKLLTLTKSATKSERKGKQTSEKAKRKNAAA